MSYGKSLIGLVREEKSRGIHADTKQKFFYLQHEEDEFQFQMKFKDVDKYGIVLDYISVSKKVPIMDVEVINKKLDEQVTAITRNITFLLEDFKLIEMDTQNKRAQLRSYPPQTKDNSKYYYEIVLDEGTDAHFQRYEYCIADKRFEKITSQLTLETFERLVDELTNALK